MDTRCSGVTFSGGQCSKMFDHTTHKYCNDHQYMNEYTPDMVQRMIRCSMCKRFRYYPESDKLKTCDMCREKLHQQRLTKEKCHQSGCNYNASIDGYCKRHIGEHMYNSNIKKQQSVECVSKITPPHIEEQEVVESIPKLPPPHPNDVSKNNAHDDPTKVCDIKIHGKDDVSSKESLSTDDAQPRYIDDIQKKKDHAQKLREWRLKTGRTKNARIPKTREEKLERDRLRKQAERDAKKLTSK